MTKQEKSLRRHVKLKSWVERGESRHLLRFQSFNVGPPWDDQADAKAFQELFIAALVLAIRPSE